jgi:hypothetical protein
MVDVFISYAREDLAAARRLAETLSHQGWSIWWDQTIPVGKTWREVVGKTLDDAQCVLVLWSSNSIRRHWVIEEADAARTRGILYPVLLEKVDPPLGFRYIQAADLSAWGGDESAAVFLQLQDAVRSRLSSSEGTFGSDDAQGRLSRTTKHESGRSTHASLFTAGSLRHLVRTWRRDIIVVSLMAVAWALALGMGIAFNGACRLGWDVSGGLGGAATGEILRRSLQLYAGRQFRSSLSPSRGGSPSTETPFA